MPDFTRFGRSQREQTVGQVVALPTTMTLFAAMGVLITSATVLIYGETIWDPVKLVGRFSSPVVVAISMFTAVVATLSVNIAANVVSPANDFANAFPRLIDFKTGGLITGILGLVMQPWKLLADPCGFIFTWLVGYSGGLGSIAGVLIADYWIVRQKQLRLEDLYMTDGAYRYRSGWNWPAVIATVVGSGLALAGWFIPAMKPVYDYAWFVGFGVAFALYVVLMRGHRVAGASVAAAALLVLPAPLQAAAEPPNAAWEAYRSFLIASRNGGDIARFLTDEGLAQWRAYSPEARKVAESSGLAALHDVKLAGSRTAAAVTQLDVLLYCDPFGRGRDDELKGRVEMVHGPRGWGVRSETVTAPEPYATMLRDAGWTSADGHSWTGLRAPGVFPPAVQAKVDAAASDRREGDAWAVADVRAVIAAEAAYQSMNDGLYDRLDCLLKPVACIPGYPAKGPVFIPAALAAPRNGYHPRFDGGPRAEAGASSWPASVAAYADGMIPPAGRAGRAICGDASGVVCAMAKAPAPSADGSCPLEPACVPVH
jgi:hypothetical protein